MTEKIELKLLRCRQQVAEGLQGALALTVGDVVSRLPGLRHLSMDSWQFDDAELAKISTLTALQTLHLQFKG